MKRTWLSVLIVAGTLGLLTLFLGLQYRWLTDVSEAERERMQKRVETDAARFAEDFNREMQAAYYNFQTGADMWRSSNWREFAERFDYWRSRTEHPDLIRDIYFVSNTSAGKPLRYNPTGRVFEETVMPPELDRLKTRFTDENQFRPVYADAYAMVLPIFDTEQHVEHMVFKR